MLEKNNKDRRLRLQRLRVAVKAMLTVALAATVWVLISSRSSIDTEQREPQVLAVDISSIKPGQTRMVLWEDRPVIVLHRSRAQIAALARGENDHRLADPRSQASAQPVFALNPKRSASTEWFVAVGLGSDLGCTVKLLAESPEQVLGAAWSGGFKDTCRGSFYDLAGRVYNGQYAEKNLEIPIYLIQGSVLILGAESVQ